MLLSLRQTYQLVTGYGNMEYLSLHYNKRLTFSKVSGYLRGWLDRMILPSMLESLAPELGNTRCSPACMACHFDNLVWHVLHNPWITSRRNMESHWPHIQINMGKGHKSMLTFYALKYLFFMSQAFLVSSVWFNSMFVSYRIAWLR